MFSQYSWWDFFKVVIALAIPYYAFVAWKYYREDIRDWFINRGQDNPAPTPTDEEEQDDADLFPVNQYESAPVSESAARVSPEPKLKPGQWLPEMPSNASTTEVGPTRPAGNEVATPEVELRGPELSEATDGRFSLPVLLEAENPQEVSLNHVISAAGRISVNEAGVYQPITAGDEAAQRVAGVLNNQQGKEVFSDFRFTR